jgi:hypothetical protein
MLHYHYSVIKISIFTIVTLIEKSQYAEATLFEEEKIND